MRALRAAIATSGIIESARTITPSAAAERRTRLVGASGANQFPVRIARSRVAGECPDIGDIGDRRAIAAQRQRDVDAQEPLRAHRVEGFLREPRIAVDRFTGHAAEEAPKTLVLVSDMLENAPDYSQYGGDLTYGRFKSSRAYKRLQTDLHGAEVTIYYIQRTSAKPFNSADHIRFWVDWIRDNKGRFKQASKLQGEG